MGKGSIVQCGPRRSGKKSLRSRCAPPSGTERRPESQFQGSGEPHRGPDTGLHGDAACGVTCSFGATRVGVLLERMRLHLSTQRFLAERRGDGIWEASCDYAALSLERLGARLRPEAFAAELFPQVRPRRAPAKHRGRRRARGGR
jgi:hypothetical protein